jgi:hypothetical protein
MEGMEVEGRDFFHPQTPMNRAIQRSVERWREICDLPEMQWGERTKKQRVNHLAMVHPLPI